MSIKPRRPQSTTILTSRCTGRQIGSTLSFLERYDEMRRDLELADWRIAERMNMTYSALERQLDRYGLPVSTDLRARATAEDVAARRRRVKEATR